MKPVLCLGLAALLLGCKKDDPEVQLPAATQTGANTGGCLIDGKPFIATDRKGSLLSNGVPALSGGFFEDSLYYLEMNGRLGGQNTTVTLYFNSQQPGVYRFDKKTQYYPVALHVSNHGTYSSDVQNDTYVTNNQCTGQVILSRADVKKGISAGTLEFMAASQLYPSKTVTITSGRFDRKQ